MQYRCLGLCIMQSTILHIVHLICGSSVVRRIGSIRGTLSVAFVEASRRVGGLDTVSVGTGSVEVDLEAIVSVVGVGFTTSCWGEDDPPFSNGTCSVTMIGSTLTFSLSGNE